MATPLKRWGRERPWLMAAATGIFVCLLLLAGGGLMLRRQALSGVAKRQRRLDQAVGQMTADVIDLMSVLHARGRSDCSTANLNWIRGRMLRYRYLREVGIYDSTGRLYCTTSQGRLAKPLPDRPGGFGTADSGLLWLNVPLVATGDRVRAAIFRRGRYNIVVDPYAMARIFRGWRGVVWIRTHGRYHALLIRDSRPLGTRWPQALLARMGALPSSRVVRHGLGAVVLNPVSDSRLALSSTWTVTDILAYLPLAATFVLFGALGMGWLVAALLALHLRRAHSLEVRIRQLCHVDSVRCLYQPIIDVRSRAVIGCEVLMRIADGDQLLGAEQVLPLVRRRGLTWELDRAVAARAMREMALHREVFAGLRVGFNLFPQDVVFARAGVHLQHLLKAYDLQRTRINVEVTEHGFSAELAREALLFRHAGFQISVDDFGTGQSNLSVVRELKPDFLKIDKSFVDHLDRVTRASSLVPEIVAIGRAVGAAVVAEGVERQSQLDVLERFGVQCAQGYLFARPLTVDAFVEFVRARRAEAEPLLP